MIDAILRYLAPAQYEDLIPVAFGFQVSLPTVLCGFLLLGVAIGVGTFYWKRLDKCSAPVRVSLTVLRIVVIVLALGLLMDPAIIAQHVKPGEQIVALLFDDSLSMRIGGGTGESRGDRLVSQYTQAKAEFEDELSRKHQIVKYRVGAGLEPLSDIESLTFDEPESNLIDGVGQVLSDLEGTTVSAVILFSDGVQQADETLHTAESVSPTVPVYTVGVDTTTDWSDIELSSLSV